MFFEWKILQVSVEMILLPPETAHWHVSIDLGERLGALTFQLP
jgi:hypothetical protein